jgi:hypothetical protein
MPTFIEKYFAKSILLVSNNKPFVQQDAQNATYTKEKILVK